MAHTFPERQVAELVALHSDTLAFVDTVTSAGWYTMILHRRSLSRLDSRGHTAVTGL